LPAAAIEKNQLLPRLHTQDLHMPRGPFGQEKAVSGVRISVNEKSRHAQKV